MPGIQPFEVVEVDDHTETVGCDGGGGPLGHPMVYYTFGKNESVVCGYCSRTFVRRREAAGPGLKRTQSPDSSGGTGSFERA